MKAKLVLEVEVDVEDLDIKITEIYVWSKVASEGLQFYYEKEKGIIEDFTCDICDVKAHLEPIEEEKPF